MSRLARILETLNELDPRDPVADAEMIADTMAEDGLERKPTPEEAARIEAERASAITAARLYLSSPVLPPGKTSHAVEAVGRSAARRGDPVVETSFDGKNVFEINDAVQRAAWASSEAWTAALGPLAEVHAMARAVCEHFNNDPDVAAIRSTLNELEEGLPFQSGVQIKDRYTTTIVYEYADWTRKTRRGRISAETIEAMWEEASYFEHANRLLTAILEPVRARAAALVLSACHELSSPTGMLMSKEAGVAWERLGWRERSSFGGPTTILLMGMLRIQKDGVLWSRPGLHLAATDQGPYVVSLYISDHNGTRFEYKQPRTPAGIEDLLSLGNDELLALTLSVGWVMERIERHYVAEATSPATKQIGPKKGRLRI